MIAIMQDQRRRRNFLSLRTFSDPVALVTEHNTAFSSDENHFTLICGVCTTLSCNYRAFSPESFLILKFQQTKGAFTVCTPCCSLKPCSNIRNHSRNRKCRLKGPFPRELMREMTNGFQYENSYKFIPRALVLRALLLGSLSSTYVHCELSAQTIIRICLWIPKF